MRTLIIAACVALSGCSTQPRINVAEVRASCPSLSVPKRTDSDAQTRRIAELEGWYHACRESILVAFD